MRIATPQKKGENILESTSIQQPAFKTQLVNNTLQHYYTNIKPAA